MGVIEKSNSAWSNPVVVVRKPTGKIRMCLDFRKVNDVTVRDAHPMPLISDILGRLSGTKYLTSIDMTDAFHQLELTDRAKQVTAFSVPGRSLYQYRRMPFGLCNAPQSLCRLMDEVIGHDLEPHVFVFLDDILIACDDFEKMLSLIAEVSLRLKRAGLTISREKSKFCVDSLKYVGFVIDRNGVRTNPEKVEAMVNFPVPKTVRQVRRFLGMTGWYRKFVRNYAEIASPISDLLKLKPGEKFIWSEAANQAFLELKSRLVSAPILKLPDYSKQFVIQCDASNGALGAVLTQGEGDQESVIAFLSQKFTTAQRKYAATERECLAVLVAIKKFRQFVEGTKFKVITDCAALKWLRNFNETGNGRLCRWALQLQGYDFELVHRKGTSNVVPDALSRVVETLVGCNTWYENLEGELVQNSAVYEDFKLLNGHVYKYVKGDPNTREWKLVVKDCDRHEIMSESHDSPTAGHFGVLKTLKRMQENYFWPKMAQDVRRFVGACNVCKAGKTSNLGQRSEMGHPKPGVRPFQVLSLDFMGPLPRSKKGNTVLLVVTDSFTKFVRTCPMRAATAKAVISFLEENIFFLFGVPEIIISDNGSQFIAKIFKEFLTAYGVTHWLNAIYHPQNNPTERVNQVLANSIRCYVGSDHRDWDRELQKITCAINTSFHEATQYTPFYLNFGRQIRLSGKKVYDEVEWEPQKEIILSDVLRDTFEKVKDNLHKSYIRNQRRYDLRARPIIFKPGSVAWRRNFVQSDALKKFSAKLAPKKVKGVITRKVGSNTYEFKDDLTGKTAILSVDDLFPD
jgi:hypothetical protein